MSLNLFLVLVVASAIITPIVILLIPRARRSTVFDALLWGATLLVAFLGGWYAFGIADPDNPLGGLMFSGIPILTVAIGALAGAMAVNLPLWLIDRFEHPSELEDDWDSEQEQDDDQDAYELTRENYKDEPANEEPAPSEEQEEKTEEGK